MNKNEMIMKAAVKFKGKWPEGYSALIVSTENNSCWGEGMYQDFTGLSTVMADSDAWQWVCTKSEFEELMQNLVDKAPEGATHYSQEDENNHQSWWKLVGAEMYCICERGNIYTWERGYFNKSFQLIPLPKCELEKWMPEVGQECECKFFHADQQSWVKCYIVGKTKNLEWLVYHTHHNDGLNFANIENGSIEFRPLRTEAEIERESLIAMACAVAYDGMYDEFAKVSNERRCKSIAESFVDAGWRPND